MRQSLIPARTRSGAIYENCFVDRKTGSLWRRTKQGVIKKMTIYLGTGPYCYPRVAIYNQSTKKCFQTYAHLVVADTCVPFNPVASGFLKENGISLQDWKRTPDSVKRAIKRRSLQVNHIDHNKANYHPSNLEWVTAQANQRKYQEHRRNS